MATEKVHSMIYTSNDVTRFCHYLNYCCEAQEKGHKLWVGQQGSKTNQGPEVQLTMMLHFLHKECSSLLCEAVQGEFQTQIHLKNIDYLLILFYLARIDNNDPGFEHDNWMKRKKPSEPEEPLRGSS
jgi:hypothetical protein